MFVLLSVAAMAHPADATADHGVGRHLEGTWERLPAPPSPAGLGVADAVALPDGDIVILNTIRGETNSGACVSVFDPQSTAWTKQPILPDAIEDGGCFLAYEQFIVAPDGRMHSSTTVIDPTREAWEVDPGRLGDLGLDVSDEPSIAIAGDLVYVPQHTNGGGTATRLVEIDLSTDATRGTAPHAQWNWWLVAGPADSIYAVGLAGTIARYDPADDAWHDEAPAAPAALDRTSAAMGPDGRIYVLGDEVSPYPELWAWDPEIREWLTVPIPDRLSGEFWIPELVAGHDAALYAMDIAQPYRFVPGEVAEPATPEPMPTGGGYGGVTGPTPTRTPTSAPAETSTPTTTLTPTATPTSSESPATASTNPTQSPAAAVDAAPAGAAADEDGLGLLVLLLVVIVAFLGVAGVMGYRWWQDRHPRGDPAA